MILQDKFAIPEFVFLLDRLESYRGTMENVSSDVDLSEISTLMDHVEIITLTVDQLERLHLAKDNSDLTQVTGLLTHNAVLLAGIGILLLGLSVLGCRRLLRSIGGLLAKLYEAHESLTKSENRLSSIVEYAADGIITIDDSGIVETFNVTAEKLLGYTAEEAIGKNLSCYIPEPNSSKPNSDLKQHFDTDKKGRIGIREEVAGRRKDGTSFPMDLIVTYVQLGDRHIFTAIVRDLTDIKRVEEELHKLGKAMDESINLIYPGFPI